MPPPCLDPLTPIPIANPQLMTSGVEVVLGTKLRTPYAPWSTADLHAQLAGQLLAGAVAGTPRRSHIMNSAKRYLLTQTH